MKNIPKKIYVQIGEECDADSFTELDEEQVTWSSGKVFTNDIEYTLTLSLSDIFTAEKIEEMAKEHATTLVPGHITWEQINEQKRNSFTYGIRAAIDLLTKNEKK